MHSAAGNWLYAQRGWRALSHVSHHYAAAADAEALHSGVSLRVFGFECPWEASHMRATYSPMRWRALGCTGFA